MFLCGLVPIDFANIFQGYYTYMVCQWSNSEEYGQLDHLNWLGANNMITTVKKIVFIY